MLAQPNLKKKSRTIEKEKKTTTTISSTNSHF